MGDWNISINGSGAHDNGSETDADAMAKGFVEELLSAGHQIRDAKIVTGSEKSLKVVED